ncbi:hypothetical protein pb186bvf_003851 [Paramecium bursaria]
MNQKLSPKRSISTKKIRQAIYFYKKDKEILDMQIRINEICEKSTMTVKEVTQYVRTISADSQRSNSSSRKFRIKTETTRQSPSNSFSKKAEDLKLRRNYFEPKKNYKIRASSLNKRQQSPPLSPKWFLQLPKAPIKLPAQALKPIKCSRTMHMKQELQIDATKTRMKISRILHNNNRNSTESIMKDLDASGNEEIHEINKENRNEFRIIPKFKLIKFLASQSQLY